MSTDTLQDNTPESIETSTTEQNTEHVVENAAIYSDESMETSLSEVATIENATETTQEEVPAYSVKTFDIDVDFDTYTVSEKRADSIRAMLSNVKAKTWLSSLRDWIEAEGQAYYPYGEQTEMGETPCKRIAWEEGHPLATLEVINDGVDTEIRIEGKRYLSLQKLPKGDELLLSNFNPDLTSKFSEFETELHSHLKVFLKVKADKQKAFQEKFKK